MDNFWLAVTFSAHCLFLWIVFKRKFQTLIPFLTGLIICRVIETPIESWAYHHNNYLLHWNLFWGFGVFNLLLLAASFAETRKILPAVAWTIGIYLVPKTIEYVTLVSCEEKQWPSLAASLMRPMNLLCVLSWCYILRPREPKPKKENLDDEPSSSAQG